MGESGSPAGKTFADLFLSDPSLVHGKISVGGSFADGGLPGGRFFHFGAKTSGVCLSVSDGAASDFSDGTFESLF